jgi:hypothetical protein
MLHRARRDAALSVDAESGVGLDFCRCHRVKRADNLARALGLKPDQLQPEVARGAHELGACHFTGQTISNDLQETISHWSFSLAECFWTTRICRSVKASACGRLMHPPF